MFPRRPIYGCGLIGSHRRRSKIQVDHFGEPGTDVCRRESFPDHVGEVRRDVIECRGLDERLVGGR